jgi:hypothetical protein
MSAKDDGTDGDSNDEEDRHEKDGAGTAEESGVKKGKSKDSSMRNAQMGDIDRQRLDEKCPNGQHQGQNSNNENYQQEYGSWMSNSRNADLRRYRWDPEFGANVAFVGRNYTRSRRFGPRPVFVGKDSQLLLKIIVN